MVNSDNSGFSINFNADKNSSRTRPSSPTRNPKKNFEEVMRKEERHKRDRNDEDHFVKGDKEETKTKKSYDRVANELGVKKKSAEKTLSIFDIQKGETAKAGAEAASIGQIPKEIEDESLSALFKGYGDQEKLQAIQFEVNKETSTALGEEEIKQIVPKSNLQEINMLYKEEKPNVSPKFTTEQPDLSSVNPMAGMQSQSAAAQAATTAQRANQVEMQEIVDQIVSKLYTLKVAGQTDTTITLRHPPLFAGAQVVISAFDSARGEFNVTFENLTQAAKQLLDLQENQGALKKALEQKGFVLHILTTTTTMESRPFVEEGNPSRGEREESGEEHAGKEGREEHEERQG